MTATFTKVLLAITALLAAACGVSPDATANRSLDLGPDTVTLPPVEATDDTVAPDSTPPVTAPSGTDAPIVGTIEQTTVTAPGYVTVSGWAQASGSGAPIELIAWLDGAPVATVLTDGAGFVVDVAVAPGDHAVCVTTTGTDLPLDCIDLDVEPAAETVDDGTVLLTAVDPDPDGSVAVRGVITGPDHPAWIDVWIDVTAPHDRSTTTQLAVDRGTFRFDVDGLADGTYTLCPTASGVTITTDPVEAPAPCGTAVVGPVSIGTTGRATGIRTVAPADDHPLHLMERDGGISVELTDGSTLWFFGDTMETLSDDEVVYFVNNTAAWASADAPTLTRDVAANEPVLFAAPPNGTCDGSKKAALWPESAVVIPQDDGTDRVVVVMSKVCLGNHWLDIKTVGFAVAEYRYDPDDPPVDRAITGVVTQPHLADDGAGYGRALLLEPDGFLYGYECGSYPDDWDACHVARVRPEQVTEPAAWRYWNGHDWTEPRNWVPDEAAAAAMELPGDPRTALPVAAFGVTDHRDTDDQDDGVNLMVYSPWPGFCGVLAVRASDTPVGPWTDAVEIAVPDCTDLTKAIDQHCYAGTPQTQLCEPGTFAGGYYDMYTDDGVAHYYTFVTPFVVVLGDR